MKHCIQASVSVALILIAASIPAWAQQVDPALLTLDRVVSDELEEKSFGPAVWLEDSSAYTVVEAPDADGDEGAKGLVRYDSATGEREVVVPAWRLVPPKSDQPIKIDSHSWSADGSRLLLSTNTQTEPPRVSRADYWILDLSLWVWHKLGGSAPPQSLSAVEFSPDGSRVSYVMGTDLYVEDLTSFSIVQLTESESEKIFNGRGKGCNSSMLAPPHSHRSGRSGSSWSPDGQSIAYVQVDMRHVPDFYMLNNTDTLYPEIIKFPYVKVGQRQPSYRVGVVSAGGGDTTWIDVPGDPFADYLWQMEWAANSDELLLQVLNRKQNAMKVMLASTTTDDVRTILVEKDEAWLEPNSVKWLEEGTKFPWLSERDGWQHIYLYDRSGEELRELTPGAFDVTGIQGVDEENGWVYYIASPRNATQRYLFRTSLDAKMQHERVTPESLPGMNEYQLSPNARWALHTHSTINTPPVTSLVSLPDHKVIMVLEDNDELAAKLAALEISPTEFFRVGIEAGAVELDAYRIKPPGMDPEKKHPLLFYIYGEPARQTVLDRWQGRRHMWHLMLAQQGYVVMSVDGRGTPAPRGREWRKIIYRKLGIQAALDHGAATRQILKETDYIDPEKVGIYGHSGGGQMSLNLIFRYPDLYHVAMPSSFVSHQRFYHPAYQERFMGLLQENVEGYRDGSPKTWAHRLEGELLIIHGTGDSNVHFQSFESLVNELVAAKKQFSMMIYPNRNHALKEGENTQHHLYELRTDFLRTHMPPVHGELPKP